MKSNIILFLVICIKFVAAANADTDRKDLEWSQVIGAKKTYRVDRIMYSSRESEISGVFSRAQVTTIELELESLKDQELRVRVIRVVVGDDRGGASLSPPPKSSEEEKKLADMTFVIEHYENSWRPVDLHPEDLPGKGGEYVVGVIIESVMPLIFPSLPKEFTPVIGFEWGDLDQTEGNKIKKAYSSRAEIHSFKVDDIYNDINNHQVAVVKGEQRYTIETERLTGVANSIVHIEYDVDNGVVKNAFERYSLSEKIKRPPVGHGNTLRLRITNIINIPNE